MEDPWLEEGEFMLGVPYAILACTCSSDLNGEVVEEEGIEEE